MRSEGGTLVTLVANVSGRPDGQAGRNVGHQRTTLSAHDWSRRSSTIQRLDGKHFHIRFTRERRGYVPVLKRRDAT